jgi:hypothetical protein
MGYHAPICPQTKFRAQQQEKPLLSILLGPNNPAKVSKLAAHNNEICRARTTRGFELGVAFSGQGQQQQAAIFRKFQTHALSRLTHL